VTPQSGELDCFRPPPVLRNERSGYYDGYPF
jgi:hypothetical protein